jgi:hypothetical protein
MAARTAGTVNAPHLVALVCAGAVFVNGNLVERPDKPINTKSPESLHPQVLTIARLGAALPKLS